MFTKEKNVKKYLCVLMSIIITLLMLSPISVIAVEYPKNITEQQAITAISKTDALINSLCNANDTSLDKILTDTLYNDETLSELMVSIYSSIEKDKDLLKSLNLDTSPEAVGEHLKDFSEIYSRLSSASSWSEVDLSEAEWNIRNEKDFAKAVSAVFGPFNDLLYTMLCSGSFSLNKLIGLIGSNGYETAVIPILKNFGLENPTSPEKFYAAAEQNKYSMVQNIVLDVMSYVKGLCNTPADKITEYLPNIAYFIKNDGLDNAIIDLINPLRIKILNIPTIFKVGMFLRSTEQLTNGISFNIGDAASGITQLKLSPISLDDIIACGTVSGDTVFSRKGDMFVYLLKWIVDTVKINEKMIQEMIGEGNEKLKGLEDILKNLMATPTDDIVAAYIEFMSATGGVKNNYQWTYKEITPTQITYTQNLDQDDFTRMILETDALINDFIAEGGECKNFREMFAPQIYSNKLVSQIVCGIYSAFEAKEMKDVLPLLGLNVTPSSLALSLSENKYSKTRSTLYNSYAFTDINTETLNWGFKDGDKDGFIDAVSAAFRPLEPVLKMLLAEDKITLFDSIEFYGSDGYNAAIIPLFEAISCESRKILTYEEYKERIKKDDVMKPIVETLVSKIDAFLYVPAITATEIVPNLVYFIDNDGLQICINNLLYPITNVLNKLGVENVIDFSSVTEEINVTDLIKDMDLGIKFPEFDIHQFASIGTPTTVQSKRTVNGEFVNVTYIQSNHTGVIITVLRYLVNTLKMPENANVLTSFMDTSMVGEGNEMMAGFANDMLNDLSTKTTDETIEWVHQLFFRERPVVEEKIDDDYMPTIIYEDKDEEKENKAIGFICFVLGLVLVFVFIKRKKIVMFVKERKENDFISSSENFSKLDFSEDDDTDEEIIGG